MRQTTDTEVHECTDKPILGNARIDGRVLTSGILDQYPLLYMYINGLLVASRTEDKRVDGHSRISLHPGEFLCNIGQLCSRFNMSRYVLRGRIKILEDTGLVTSRPAGVPNYIILRICNWEELLA